MDGLVSQNQSVFIGGRLIQNNIIISQEIFHSLKTRGRNLNDCLAIKHDLCKAYDRLHWLFLEKTLLAYGFKERWVDLVMTLVRGVSYKFKINGFMSRR